MNGIEIRPVRTGELEAVARLRWQWAKERQRTPVTSRDEFVSRFVTWALRNASSHRCVVVARDDEVIGMAWLAVTQRVPHPGAPERASGDLQCVYVSPEERGGGLGGRLIEEVLALARESGLERLTVHSSDAAVPAYLRAGFSHSRVLLQTEPGAAAGPGTDGHGPVPRLVKPGQ
ncbi:GNAT family N-acetyltransferase [Streptomyces bathyalis]|uniref:GNAT family N-acetyltransferase n=1 Tax=Streptomyces bathyalis TaxID=2710756 RepID=A0A7T1WVA2_9ACTN|nr:GNAT family N-acetyltransferase [Streptomyces bathyalis]QPP08755.1 GNAT family N-acetyltransferase [Streptomyces bathyalis]